jgi:tRNA (guanine37-N1)-methyltransferase
VIRGYDVIGDIAIIIVPQQLVHLEKSIADGILHTGKNIRLVAKRVGIYRGEYRIISLEIIGGQGDLKTVHREYGVRLHVDMETVYYSPRSADERYRLAHLVQSGERVLVMFSGVAPLPLMIGAHSEAALVMGVEKNPYAHILAVKNLKANRKIDNVSLYQGDVRQVVPRLSGKFNRIAMPLPLSAITYLDLALAVLADGGWIHYYDFQKIGEFERAEEALRRACSALGREVVQSNIQKCGHVSPGKYRICVDAMIE